MSLSFYLFLSLFLSLSIYLSIYISLCLCLSLSFYLFLFLPFPISLVFPLTSNPFQAFKLWLSPQDQSLLLAFQSIVKKAMVYLDMTLFWAVPWAGSQESYLFMCLGRTRCEKQTKDCLRTPFDWICYDGETLGNLLTDCALWYPFCFSFPFLYYFLSFLLFFLSSRFRAISAQLSLLVTRSSKLHIKSFILQPWSYGGKALFLNSLPGVKHWELQGKK